MKRNACAKNRTDEWITELSSRMDGSMRSFISQLLYRTVEDIDTSRGRSFYLAEAIPEILDALAISDASKISPYVFTGLMSHLWQTTSSILPCQSFVLSSNKRFAIDIWHFYSDDLERQYRYGWKKWLLMISRALAISIAPAKPRPKDNGYCRRIRRFDNQICEILYCVYIYIYTCIRVNSS